MSFKWNEKNSKNVNGIKQFRPNRKRERKIKWFEREWENSVSERIRVWGITKMSFFRIYIYWESLQWKLYLVGLHSPTVYTLYKPSTLTEKWSSITSIIQLLSKHIKKYIKNCLYFSRQRYKSGAIHLTELSKHKISIYAKKYRLIIFKL